MNDSTGLAGLFELALETSKVSLGQFHVVRIGLYRGEYSLYIDWWMRVEPTMAKTMSEASASSESFS